MRTHASETNDFYHRLPAALIIFAASFALPPGIAAHETILESTWRTMGEIDDEKAPTAVPLEKGRVSVAVSNDDRFLYFTLTTNDRSLYYSMYRSGMTLWIDPKGGRRETVGLRYPIGLDGDPVSELRGQISGGNRWPASSVPPDRWLELVGTGDDYPRRVAIGDVPGLDVHLRETDGTFVYEAKLPLVTSNDRSLVVGAAAGGTIGVGWKTDRRKSEDVPPSGGRQPGGMGGGSGGGSHGGMGGGSHGGMGGGSHGGMGGGAHREDHGGPADDGGSNVKPLHVWVKVRLAANGAPLGSSSEGN